MPVYNNSAFAQAADNIARMFAPPSAGDVANYANARALLCTGAKGIIDGRKVAIS